METPVHRPLAIGICFALALAAGAASAAPTYRVTDRIAGPDGRWDYVRVDAGHRRLLVAHGAAVMAVDLATRAVTPSIASGVYLHDALPIDGDRQIVVTDGSAGTATFLAADGAGPAVVVKAGQNPDAVAFDAKSGLVLVMNHGSGDVTLVDARTHAVTGAVSVGGALEAAAVDEAGHAFINIEDRNEIAVLDLATKSVTARYKLKGCDGPTGLAYDRDDRLLIAACDGASVLVDAASGETLQALATGGGADGVVFDATRRLAFVPSGDDGRLAVISVGRRDARIIQSVVTEPGARTLAIDPETGRLYLPVAERAPPTAAGGRGPLKPGTFHVLVVGP